MAVRLGKHWNHYIRDDWDWADEYISHTPKHRAWKKRAHRVEIRRTGKVDLEAELREEEAYRHHPRRAVDYEWNGHRRWGRVHRPYPFPEDHMGRVWARLWGQRGAV